MTEGAMVRMSTPADTYPVRFDIQTRFGDVDMHGHLNNVAQARLYEEGVSRFHRFELAGLWEDGLSVVGEVRIRYLSEGRYPGELTLCGGMRRVGNSSFTMEQALWQGDRQVSICRTTSVYRKFNASVRLPEAFRARLFEFLLADAGTVF